MRPQQKFVDEFNGLKVGQKVHFVPDYAESLKDCENGRIRSIIMDHYDPKKAHFFVVFGYDDDWQDVMKNTAELTPELNISDGWIYIK